MPIKLIVSDLDDTLLRSDATISPRTERVLKRVRQLGADVVLASGRMVCAMKPYAEQLAITAPMISYNGALVVNPQTGETISSLAIPCELACRLARMAEEMNLHVQGYYDDRYFFREDNSFSELYAQSIGVRGSAVHAPLSTYMTRDNAKMLLIDEPARIAEVAPLFRQAFGEQLDCAISRPRYIECTNRLATKGNALKMVLEHLQVRLEEVVAFGDGQNDLSMLNLAGLGYTPANARPDVQRQARRICPANDDDGVAQILEELIEQGRIGGR